MAGYEKLTRGGYIVHTSLGPVQVGVPPETIKDTMLTDYGVPNFFVLPTDLFDWIKGISIAEIEFPLYFNFFVRKQKTHVICQKRQISCMKAVLQESLFGPKDLDVTHDFQDTDPDSPFQYFNLKKEIDYFRSTFELDDLIKFVPFKHDRVSFTKGKKSLIIEFDEDNLEYNFIDSDQGTVQVPARVEYNPRYFIGERLVEPYIPPLFGITCLGPSHGFDPKENTSGYILWINHEGIMIDPPVESTEWLIDSNVNPKLIDTIILTHCHADHDAGTFQKILEEGRITIYTTETVLMSFLRKYSALSGISIESLKNLFIFHPIKIGEPVFIHGAKFIMTYSLHSIPTIGFRCQFREKKIVYTSDHNNDPEKHKELFDQRIFSPRRYDELTHFPWDADVIYHESGIPPLHTPIAFLNSLEPDIQEKIVVYHIADKDFPEDTKLSLATFGIENTRYYDVEPSDHIDAYKIMGLLKHIDFFQVLPLYKMQEFLTIVKEEQYQKGDKIIEKGSPGDKFYIIYMGNVSVHSGDEITQRKIYGSYDYFGEVALVTKQNRAADVYAETNVILYTVNRDEFLSFIAGTEFETILKRLAKIRTSETWNLLAESPVFRYMSPTQKTWIESMFLPVSYDGSDVLSKEGSKIVYMYLIRSGEIEMQKSGKTVRVLKRGDVIHSLELIYKKKPSEYTYKYNGPVALYAMQSTEIFKFAQFNPGLIMKLKYHANAARKYHCKTNET
jgi:CRP-like cAMP-binding protein